MGLLLAELTPKPVPYPPPALTQPEQGQETPSRDQLRLRDVQQKSSKKSRDINAEAFEKLQKEIAIL